MEREAIRSTDEGRSMTVTLEGMAENAGLVELGALWRFLQALERSLCAVEREITGEKRKKCVRYIITELSTAPEKTVVTLAAFPKKGKVRVVQAEGDADALAV